MLGPLREDSRIVITPEGGGHDKGFVCSEGLAIRWFPPSVLAAMMRLEPEVQSMDAMLDAYMPVSLGYTCETKFQLCRALWRRANSSAPLDDLRAVISSSCGSKMFRHSLFDWQVTPFQAVLAYLAADFQGVFERADLVFDPAAGAVVHRSLGTQHPHEFHLSDTPLLNADIDRLYPAARAKFDHLTDRFRSHLATPGLFLYVFTEIQSGEMAGRLLDLLSERNPSHEAHLLMVDQPGCDGDISALGSRASKAWRVVRSEKADEYQWEGPDRAWDDILRPFLLRADPQ